MLQKDLLAGLTVAFVALPQCMAYALLAGVAPQYGLYAFMVASIVGSLAGSSRHLQTGPTNASSIVAASAVAAYVGREDFMAIVFLLTLLSGLFQLTLGLLKLGNLTQLVSSSVLLGFTSGAGVLIVANQLPNLLGLPSKGSVSVLGQLRYVASGIADTDPTVLALGVGTFFLALLLSKVSPKTPAGAPLFPAYLLAILGAAGVVAFLGLHETGVRVVGNIPASLPPLSMPAFSWELIQALASGAIALSLIGLAEAFASAKSVASFSGDRIDTNREFVGQGVAKIVVAFFSGIPVSGSLTRSALMYQAGAESKKAHVFSGVMLAGLVFALGPVTRYIPVASLAGILLIIAVKMVRWEHVKLALTATRSDALAFLATFAAALLLPLADAIYVGVGVSLALFVRRARVPRVVELVYDEKKGFREVTDADERPCPEVAIVHVEGPLFFGAADYLEEKCLKVASRPEVQALILRLKQTAALDATTLLALGNVSAAMKRQDKLLIISGATPEVEELLHRVHLIDVLGPENVFVARATILESTTQAFAHALDYVKKKH
ncbi:MAG: SulP family inorganic anion transporter [Acidobacteria bacterium]|nr:MAG: SulP family inorganic anion transporter [Acidobacteriota bacterium]